MLDVGEGDYPALVAVRGDGEVVAYAVSMRDLVLHVDAPPDGARLEPERLDEIGPRWWRVNPFAADVSIPDTAAELRRWFAALR